MAELPTDLQRLVAEARLAHDPDDAAQQRVRAALAATLTTGVAAGATVTTIKAGSVASSSVAGTGAASATKSALLLKLAAAKTALLTGASVVVVGGGVWAVSQGELSEPAPSPAPRSEAVAIEQPGAAHVAKATEAPPPAPQAAPPPPPAEPAVAPAEQAASAEPAVAPAEQAASAPAPTTAVHRVPHSRPALRTHAGSARASQRRTSAASSPRATAAVVAADAAPELSVHEPEGVTSAPSQAGMTGLGEELSLIRRATSAVSTGHYAAALAALEEHATRYPAGSLVEERLGLRAVSLCKLQRDSAHAAAQTFADKHPDSPLLARVRAACEDLP